MAKCPRCEKPISRLSFTSLDAASGLDSWKAVVYSCPACGCAIGAQIDPLAIKADIVNDVAALLGKR